MSSPYDPSYLQGIAHFNNRQYFEAHEVWEEVWMPCQGESRLFYQGLIQVAVCLHHFGRGNTRGARKLYHSSRRYLAHFQPWHLGVDLRRLQSEMDDCLAEVVASDEATPKVTLDDARLPHIHFCETGGSC